jgi:hypothetical protein
MNLHFLGVGSSLLKIQAFISFQINQHIRIMISSAASSDCKIGVKGGTFSVPQFHVYIGRNSLYRGKLKIRISLQGKNYTMPSINQSRSSYAIDA